MKTYNVKEMLIGLYYDLGVAINNHQDGKKLYNLIHDKLSRIDKLEKAEWANIDWE